MSASTSTPTKPPALRWAWSALYLTQKDLAKKVADGIAKATGLPNRGPKYRDNLFFLNSTSEPAVLAEVVFVDSSTDAAVYEERFNPVCSALAEALSGKAIEVAPPVCQLSRRQRRRSFRRKSRGG